MVDVPDEVIAMLQQHWGYDDLRGGQSATIARVLQWRIAAVSAADRRWQVVDLSASCVAAGRRDRRGIAADRADEGSARWFTAGSARNQAIAINSTMSASEVARVLA